MNLFSRSWWKAQARHFFNYNNNDPAYGYRVVGGEVVGRTPVSEHSALSLAAFWAGVRLISEKIAEFPTDVMQINGGRRREVPHPTKRLLNGKASRFANSFDYTQILIAHAIMHGNGYALIGRTGGRIDELLNIHPRHIKPIKYDGDLFYEFDPKDGGDSVLIAPSEMVHIKGFGTDPCFGLSMIQQHKVNLGLALAARDYGVDVFNKGTRIDGYLQYPGKMDAEVKDAIADSWNKNYGPNGTRSIAILDGDTKYQPLQLKPEDAQFLETRTFSTREIATILGVPPHMLGDMEHATFSNIEHQNAAFLSSLMSWIRRVEQEYNSKLLREREKTNTEFKLNFNALLRTDTKARGEFYEVMHRIGAVSPNEIRQWEDMNPYEGGDNYYYMLNMGIVGQEQTQNEENGEENN